MMKLNQRLLVVALALVAATAVMSSSSSARTVNQNQVGLNGNGNGLQGIYDEFAAGSKASRGLAEDDGHDDGKPWGEVILASLLINLATLTGLIAIVCSFIYSSTTKHTAEERHNMRYLFVYNIIPSFACGALLATSVFLIIPESIFMLTDFHAGGEDAHDDEDGHDDHDEDEDHSGHNHFRFLAEGEDEDHEEHEEVDYDIPVAWRFGASLIAGFLIPILSAMLYPHQHVEPDQAADLNATASPTEVKSLKEESSDGKAQSDSDSNNDVVKKDETTAVAEKDAEEDAAAPADAAEGANDEKDQTINWTLASSVLLGDFFHNFTDGVLVGTSFLLCSRDLAITIAAATVYHELAQELADYFILTKHCGLSTVVALSLNFIGGLSVLLGAILILAVDVSSNATGCLLAVSAGVYMHIVGAECLPIAQKSHRSMGDKLVTIVSFVCGVLPIGLLLLNEQHC